MRVMKTSHAFLFVILCAFLPLLASAQTPATVPVSVSFTKTSLYDDGSAIPSTKAVTYKIYAGTRGSTNKALWITTAAVTASGNQSPGTCFEVSATVDGIEGEHSDEACLGRKPAKGGGLIVTTTTTQTQTTVTR